MSPPGPVHQRSSVEGAEDVCPICLCPMDEGFSRPENCQHRFDLECLTEWSKLRLSCPSCRAGFGAIYTYEIIDVKPKLVKVQKMEPPKETEPFDETNPHDFTMCEICAGGQHEELLLICDQCDKGFHTYCLTPPLDGVPTSEQWFCPRCEQTRNSLPSTSRSTAPSARAVRLVQRTALAERVRRLLQRTRRVFDVSDENTEDESGSDEEEEEDGEEEEEVEDAVDSSSEEEEEMHDFFDDDARVLAEIDNDIRDEPTLPSVQRRKKQKGASKKKSTKSSKRKRKTGKKTGKGKKRKTKSKRHSRKSKRTVAKQGPMDAFVSRRGTIRDPVARLSLLGAGLEPVAEEDPLITENSRRFDRPLLRRRDEEISAFRNEVMEEEKPVVDSCDLIGSIIPEQVKTLAPGRLFAVRGGRFNTTDDFEKYNARQTNHLSSELKERLGIPVEKNVTSDCRERADTNKSRDLSKEKIHLDGSKRLTEHSSSNDMNSVPPKTCTSDRNAYRPSLNSGRGEVTREPKKEVLQDSFKRPLSNYRESKPHNREDRGLGERHRYERCRDESYTRNRGPTSENERYDRNSREATRWGNRSQPSSHNSLRDQATNHRPYHHVSSSYSSHHCHRDDLNRHGNTVSKDVAKTEESEQEDKVVVKKPDEVENKEGIHKQMANVWMPNFNGSSAAESSAKSATLPSNVADKRGEKEKTTNAEDRVKLIESFAKDAIKHYKRSITVEEYKNVMRAVVRECYKKKILDGGKIKEKVNEFVRAVKNGEQLSEHHSSKRSETSGEDTSIVPVKRQKCEA